MLQPSTVAAQCRRATLSQSAQVDQFITHIVEIVCPACKLERTNFEVIENRQVFALPEIRAKVTEHVLKRAYCSCGVPHTCTPEGQTS